MQSLADNLPPEVANRIHPDWRKNERDFFLVWVWLDGHEYTTAFKPTLSERNGSWGAMS